MRAALRWARRGLGRTSPNPPVGAVVVAQDRVVGAGYHSKAGEPHAEVFALDQAGDAARGATLYVTLEPCCHTGKRTPPCVDRVLASGVRRVVVGAVDPNPRVAGGGLAKLAAAGLEVQSGVLAEEAGRLIEGFARHVTTGLPLVTLKLAASLDGRACALDRSSRWITGPAARREVHRLRDASDAVLVGIGTALADDPALTTRVPRGGRDAVRVVLDSEARLPPGARMLAQGSAAPTLVFASERASGARTRALAQAGAEVLVAPLAAGHVDLFHVLAELGRRGLCTVLAEAGPRLSTALLRLGLVDKIVAFVAPKLIGGDGSNVVVQDLLRPSIGQALALERACWRIVGADAMLEAYVRPESRATGRAALAPGEAD